MTLQGRVVICGTEGTDGRTVAEATAGALFDWARGVWGPLEVELFDEEGRWAENRTVDRQLFLRGGER